MLRNKVNVLNRYIPTFRNNRDSLNKSIPIILKKLLFERFFNDIFATTAANDCLPLRCHLKGAIVYYIVYGTSVFSSFNY